jgi:hypothetical protein
MEPNLHRKSFAQLRLPLKWVFRWARHQLGHQLMRRKVKPFSSPTNRPAVLIVGVYVSRVKHFAAELSLEYASSKHCQVTQRWASLGRISDNLELAKVTEFECLAGEAKFSILNTLLKGIDLSQFDFIVVSDDDISVQPGFLDAFIGIQQTFGFSICQPARSWTSSIDHQIVRRRSGCVARQTRFVEIGPIFSFHKTVYSSLIPFDLETPMGWGYDYVWPVVVEKLGLTMGIVDQTPVDHTLRPRGEIYSSDRAYMESVAYRRKHSGLIDSEAYTVLKEYRHKTTERH